MERILIKNLFQSPIVSLQSGHIPETLIGLKHITYVFQSPIVSLQSGHKVKEVFIMGGAKMFQSPIVSLQSGHFFLKNLVVIGISFNPLSYLYSRVIACIVGNNQIIKMFQIT